MIKEIRDILSGKASDEDLVVEDLALEQSADGNKDVKDQDAEDDNEKMDEAKKRKLKKEGEMDSGEEEDDTEGEDEVSESEDDETDSDEIEEAIDDGSVKKAEKLTSKTSAPAGKGATGEDEDGEKEAQKDAAIIKKSAPAKTASPDGDAKAASAAGKKVTEGNDPDDDEDDDTSKKGDTDNDMKENADDDEDDIGGDKDMKEQHTEPDADEKGGKSDDDEDDMKENADDDEDDIGGDKDIEENADDDEDDKDMEESAEVVATKIIKSMLKTSSPNVSEDIEALVNGEEALTEEFKSKAVTIFEAAVSSKVKSEIGKMQAEFSKQVKSEIEAMHETLTNQLDKYLGYVVEEWIDANEVAVTNKLRTEITEGFIATLKDAFTEHYIEVPDGKVDLFDEVSIRLDESVEAQKAAEIKAEQMAEELEQLKREKIIREASDDLADTQVSKLRSLVEDVEFVSSKAFAKKVATIKESYFSKKKASTKIEKQDDSSRVITTIVEEADDENISADMKRYIRAATAIDKEGLKFNKTQ